MGIIGPGKEVGAGVGAFWIGVGAEFVGGGTTVPKGAVSGKAVGTLVICGVGETGSKGIMDGDGVERLAGPVIMMGTNSRGAPALAS